MRSVVPVIAMSLVAPGARADTLDERALEGFPDAVRQLVALEDGAAYALGADEHVAAHAVWIAPDGKLRRDPIPVELGVAYQVTPDLAWMIGSDGVAHREVAGWNVIARHPSPGLVGSQLVVLSPTSVLVARPSTTGFVALELDTAGNASEEVALRGLRLDSLVADGFGGAWAIVRAPYDGHVGYAKYERGTWTLWRGMHDRKPLLDGFRLVERVAQPELAALASDGNGGCFAVSATALFHITAGGGFRKLTELPGQANEGPPIGLAYDASLGQLQLVRWPHDETVPARLLRFDTGGNLVARDVIPMPAIAPYRPGPRLVSVASGDGRIWFAVGAFVFRFQHGAFTAFYDGPTQRRERADRDARTRLDVERMTRAASARRKTRASTAIASSLALAGGGFAVAAGDERFAPATLAVTAGAAGSLAPLLLLDEVQQSGPSDNPMAKLAVAFGRVVGFTGAVGLGTLGAWGTLEAFSDSNARGRTFGGAVLGAVAGTLVSTGLMKILRDRFPRHHGMRLGIAASVVGTAATLGARVARPPAAN